jgi:hypothetical protein
MAKSTVTTVPPKTVIMLVWEEIPDNVKVYMIPLDHPMANTVIDSNGVYINGDDEAEGDPVDLLNKWLSATYSTKSPFKIIAPSEADAFLITSRESEDKKSKVLRPSVRVRHVVVCGFFL